MTPGMEEVAFGSFRLSRRARTLTAADGPVALPSRAFDVLLALIESRAGVVSKRELMQRVWGNIIVQENNLHVQIAAVRRALGPQGRDIQTVPGRGYRFIGDLSEERVLAPPRSWSAPPQPRHPPADLTPLVGREAELAAASAQLEKVRLLTLAGPPGVGKSRLARALAAKLATRLPDGCWWPDPPSAADGHVSMADRFGAALAERCALIVLDWEPAREATAPLVHGLLAAAPRLTVLHVGEAPLGLEGEHVRRIAPFSVPAPGACSWAEAVALPAVRLFAERAEAADARFRIAEPDLPLVLEVCRAVDGLPLGIELAAAWAPLVGLEPLLAPLGRRLALWEPDGRPGLRAAIEQSLSRVGGAEHRLLLRLALFEGAFTLDQAVAASFDHLAPEETMRAIASLANRSLLLVAPEFARPSYRLLELVRDVLFAAPPDIAAPPWAVERPAPPAASPDGLGLRH